MRSVRCSGAIAVSTRPVLEYAIEASSATARCVAAGWLRNGWGAVTLSIRAGMIPFPDLRQNEPMDQRRLILFLVFSFALVMLWDGWLKHNQPPVAAQQAAAGVAHLPTVAVPTPTFGPRGSGRARCPGEQVAVRGGARVVVETDLLRAPKCPRRAATSSVSELCSTRPAAKRAATSCCSTMAPRATSTPRSPA